MPLGREPSLEQCASPELLTEAIRLSPTAQGRRASAGSGPRTSRSGKSTPRTAAATVTPRNLQPARKSGSTKKSGWDTARRNYSQIAQLEAEMEEKLSLATQLEAENKELRSRELLLQVHVSYDERKMLCSSATNGQTAQLVSLLQVFSCSVDAARAEQIVARMPQHTRDFSPRDFMIVWQSFMVEVSDIVQQVDAIGGNTDLGIQALAHDLVERISNWIMTVSLNKSSLLAEIQNLNVDTCQEQVQPPAFWDDLVDKLRLTDQQCSDLCGTFALHSGLLQEHSDKMADLMRELGEELQSDLQRQPGTRAICSLGESQFREELVGQLQAAFQRYHALQGMTTFLVLHLLTPVQQCQLVFCSLPCFPNAKQILRAVGRRSGDGGRS